MPPSFVDQSWPDPPLCRSLIEWMGQCFDGFSDRVALRFMGHDIRYADIDRQSRALAAYWQAQGVVRGDRVAVLLPNVPQYAVVVAAAWRAGLVVVNLNPCTTSADLAYVLKDSGARAIVIIESSAATLEACLPQTPVKHVLVCCIGDMLGWAQGNFVNWLGRYIQKKVPAFGLPMAVGYKDAIAWGSHRAWHAPDLGLCAPALLQYTRGTTGARRGVVLLHRHVLAHVSRLATWVIPRTQAQAGGEAWTVVGLQPLHELWAFSVGMTLAWHLGSQVILLPDPNDLSGAFKLLAKYRLHCCVAASSLWSALLEHPDLEQVDWSTLQVAWAADAALSPTLAQRWYERTGSVLGSGYGLSEACGLVCVPPSSERLADPTVSQPLPGVQIRCVDQSGQELSVGETGEIEIQGPLVMAGYWQRPDATAKFVTPQGWLRTGDLGCIDAQGALHWMGRKKMPPKAMA